MVKTTFYLEEETVHVLEKLASEEGLSQGEVIQAALLSYESKRMRPAPKGIGMYRSGRSDVSERAEDLLRQAFRKDR